MPDSASVGSVPPRTTPDLADPEQPSAALADELDEFRKSHLTLCAADWQMLTRAVAALRHPEPAPRGEPTQEMCLAGMHAWQNTLGTPLTRYAAIYEAMLAAAPEAMRDTGSGE